MDRFTRGRVILNVEGSRMVYERIRAEENMGIVENLHEMSIEGTIFFKSKFPQF